MQSFLWPDMLNPYPRLRLSSYFPSPAPDRWGGVYALCDVYAVDDVEEGGTGDGDDDDDGDDFWDGKG